MAPKKLILHFLFLFVISLSKSEEIWCDFQQSFCSWTQDTGDDFDWTRRCGDTPSSGTGPSNGYQGSIPLPCNNYIYIEVSSPRRHYDTARLISEPLNNVGFYYCLSFWYYMRGVDIGSLAVRLANEENELGDLIWSEHGEQGNEWMKAEVSFMVTVGGTTVVFEGIRGNTYVGDVAIDSVKINSHICPADVTTSMPTTKDVVFTTEYNLEPVATTSIEETIYLNTEQPTTEQIVFTDHDVQHTVKPVTQFVTEFEEIVEVITEELGSTGGELGSTGVFVTDSETDDVTLIPEPVQTSLPNHEIDEQVVTCTEDQITVQIPKDNFGNADVTGLRLYDPSCKGSYNDNYVTFTFTPTTCGTISQEKDDAIVYTNLIRSSNTGTDDIIRKKDVSIPVTCSFSKKSSISNEFLPVFDRISFGANGKGDFNFHMNFYEDETFDSEKQEPVIARIGDMMYFALSVDISDEDVVLYTDNCKALPTDSTNDEYYVIQHGCMRDSTMQEFQSTTAHQRLYGIEAFMFINSGTKIVLECDLVLCDERDGISRCPTSCEEAPARKRRSTEGDKIIKRSVARTVQLVSSDNTTKSNAKLVTPSSIVSIVMFFMAVILCLATVFKMQKDQKRSQLPN
ncbi:uncharacterized protein [Antedon mediterranea]|uniref:uncharacterized protein isoform X2 n=1 Tax=Antedon mediterranea TaxID=105859 RepID=UPI003AF5F49D